jgi:tagatose-1,6-bisphosphate aldolase non-catalytic subunit AgaZ/GatZ
MELNNETAVDLADYILGCFAVAGYTEIHSDVIVAVIKDYISSSEATNRARAWIARYE